MSGTKFVKRQKKKKEKELKRRKRQKQEAVHKAQCQRASLFPKFKIASGCTADPEFINAVYSAAQNVNFDNGRHFDKCDRYFWEKVAADGIQRVEKACQGMNGEFVADLPFFGDAWRRGSLNKLSQAIYSLIPESIKNRFMPHNYFIILTKGKVIHLACHRMISRSTSRGNIHFGLSTPLLDVEGDKRLLAFTTHALERVCERIAPKWRTDIAGLMDVVRFVVYVPPFEVTTLHRDQPAVVLFAACGSPIMLTHEIYVKGVLGKQNYDPYGDCSEYRLGYCPIEFDGPFAVAKTFLPPGYKGTPEHRLLLNCELPKDDKNIMLSLVKDHVLDKQQAQEWIPLVKWFHKNGVPQVRQGIQDYQEIHKSRLDEMEKFIQRFRRNK